MLVFLEFLLFMIYQKDKVTKMKLESERTLVTVANAICLVTETIKEVAGVDVADRLGGAAISDETYATLVASEINKNIVAAKLPGA